MQAFALAHCASIGNNTVVMRCAVFSGGGTDWHVFYHFVGAVPGSTDLFSMLKRLLLEMEVVSVSKSSCRMNIK